MIVAIILYKRSITLLPQKCLKWTSPLPLIHTKLAQMHLYTYKIWLLHYFTLYYLQREIFSFHCPRFKHVDLVNCSLSHLWLAILPTTSKRHMTIIPILLLLLVVYCLLILKASRCYHQCLLPRILSRLSMNSMPDLINWQL